MPGDPASEAQSPGDTRRGRRVYINNGGRHLGFHRLGPNDVLFLRETGAEDRVKIKGKPKLHGVGLWG